MTGNLSQQGISIPDTALSVAGFSSYIQSLLQEDSHLQYVWITGEVSSLSDHRSGIFFTLSDPDRTAVIKCIVWNNARSKLVQEPKPGEEIMVYGSIRVYEKRGEYQFVVFQVLPVGEGLQALRYQQLRSRLSQEGLFDRERKRPLPPHPQTIAVVTSPSGAAWGDIRRTLKQRYPGVRVLLSPATVQGDNAPPSIVRAIERVNENGTAEVLILARGGGATEDLSCFNDEQVVRAIATCFIPVITGIGHQRDESLADLVADASVHTPTAAAEKAVPDYSQLVAEHQQRKRLLIEATRRRLHQEVNTIEQLRSRLQRLPMRARGLEKAIAHCQLLHQKLAALDPSAVLGRGYAVARYPNGTLVKSTAPLETGQELIIQLSEGKVKVKVTQIIQ
ncbi:MAG: exodeoxyribonuclease VII large subunit [Chroococcales cyanobacterium]